MATTQVSFRNRNDDGNETTATWMAALNTNVLPTLDSPFRVRLQLSQADSAVIGLVPNLYYSINGGTQFAVTTTSTVIKAVGSANLTDNEVTTEQLAGSGTFIAGGCIEDGIGVSQNIDVGEDTEHEFVVQLISADVSNGDVIRLYVFNGAAGLATYTQIPTYTISGETVTIINHGGFELDADGADEAGYCYDDTSATLQAVGTSTAVVQTTTKRSGRTALKLSHTLTNACWFSGMNVSIGANGGPDAVDVAGTVYYCFYLYTGTAPPSDSEDVFGVLTSALSIKIRLRMNTSRQIFVMDTAGTTLATFTTALTLATWYRIEVKCGDGTSAPWEVQIFSDGGTTALEVENGTADLNAGDHNTFWLGRRNAVASQTYDQTYDDWAVATGGYCGDGASLVAYTNAAGAVNTFTTGTYADVDDDPVNDGDTTYASDATAGHILRTQCESVETAGFSNNPTIQAVTPFTIGREAAGGFSFCETGLVSGSTTSKTTGGAHVDAHAASIRKKVLALDPDTSAAWTEAAVNAAECYIEFVSTGTLRVTQMGFYIRALSGAASLRNLALTGVGV